MKAVGAWALSFAILLAVYGFGYSAGRRSSQSEAVLAGAEYATTACVAQHLVTLRQVTRAIDARFGTPSTPKDR